MDTWFDYSGGSDATSICTTGTMYFCFARLHLLSPSSKKLTPSLIKPILKQTVRAHSNSEARITLRAYKTHAEFAKVPRNTLRLLLLLLVCFYIPSSRSRDTKRARNPSSPFLLLFNVPTRSPFPFSLFSLHTQCVRFRLSTFLSSWNPFNSTSRDISRACSYKQVHVYIYEERERERHSSTCEKGLKRAVAVAPQSRDSFAFSPLPFSLLFFLPRFAWNPVAFTGWKNGARRTGKGLCTNDGAARAVNAARECNRTRHRRDSSESFRGWGWWRQGSVTRQSVADRGLTFVVSWKRAPAFSPSPPTSYRIRCIRTCIPGFICRGVMVRATEEKKTSSALIGDRSRRWRACQLERHFWGKYYYRAKVHFSSFIFPFNVFTFFILLHKKIAQR